MKKTWIVVADESMARILAWDQEQHILKPIETITNSAALADDANSRRGAFGRQVSGDGRVGNITISGSDNAQQWKGALFAERIAALLAESKQNGLFQSLRLSAAPRFLSQLREAFSTEIIDCVVEAGNKDLVHSSNEQLTRFFFERTIA